MFPFIASNPEQKRTSGLKHTTNLFLLVSIPDWENRLKCVTGYKLLSGKRTKAVSSASLVSVATLVKIFLVTYYMHNSVVMNCHQTLCSVWMHSIHSFQPDPKKHRQILHLNSLTKSSQKLTPRSWRLNEFQLPMRAFLISSSSADGRSSGRMLTTR